MKKMRAVRWLLFSTYFVSSIVIGSARIARVPESVVQNYEGGDYSKLECPLGSKRKNEQTCQITIKEGRSRVVAKFDASKFGYTFMTQEYRIFGRFKDNDLTFVLAVDCNDTDIKLMGTIPRLDAECHLVYALRERELVAEQVTIRYELDGKMVQLSRDP